LAQHDPIQTRRRLWRFHGGTHPPGEKDISTGKAVAAAPLPRLLSIPLQQHIGASAKPLVGVGDWVLKGQRIAEAQGYVSSPIHASSSGTVTAIEARPVPHPSGLSETCIVIKTNGLDEWARLPKPLDNYEDLDASVVRERIRWAGIVGLGGAAFPTAIKLNPGPGHRIQTLVVNGAECEPYITCDDMLMRGRSHLIVQGIRIVRHLLGAEECLIGIEDNKPEAIECMRSAASKNGIKDSTHICPIPTIYPSGGEKQLIRILTGKEVPTNGIPAQVGILCLNVASLFAIAQAVLEGKPLISRYVTLSGRGIREPQNFEVLIGTPVRDLIRAAGGMQGEDCKLVLGGPMMGFALNSEEIPITKAANCILALTADEAPDPGPILPCIRCGACADVCPANLLPQQMYWYARAKDLERVQDYNLFDCIECGCCAQVCPSHIPLVQYYRYAKTESWAREQDKRAAEHARARHEAREARLARLERERKVKLRRRNEALTKQPSAENAAAREKTGGEDPKKAVIEAAKQRAAAKKAALAKQGIGPKNTQGLTPSQQRQVDAARARRQAAAPAAADTKDPD